MARLASPVRLSRVSFTRPANGPPRSGTIEPDISALPYRVQNPAIGFYLLGFVVAIVASLVLTYAVRERAKRARLFDGPDARKVHAGNIPRVGGLAIFLSVVLALGTVQLLARDVDFGTRGTGLRIVLAGAAAVFLVGLWDDLKSLRASTKLVLQVGIAVAVYAAGLRVETLALPFVGVVHFGPIVSLAFTLVWLVGITNAFNLIDGLDGLAGGAAMFALTTMFVVGSINGRPGAALVTIVIAGATLGFLVYNFNPASIFLGDSGSLFLGFMLAGLGLLSSQKSQTIVAVAIPVVSLGLPVLDTTLAIVRRFLRGQPIFMADRGHIHHRLLSLGHSPRQVALLLYGACALLALGGMLLVNNSEYVALVLVLFGLGVGFAIQRLRFAEFEELARLVRKGVRQRGVIGRSVRIREISAQLATVEDLGTMFHALERTFGDDGFQRAEVRLRRSFLDAHDGSGRDRRFEDDVPVWSWIRPAGANAACWEIKLPLVDAGSGRIGALVLWQDGLADETSLSHIHTIARELRQVVQVKLVAFWHSSPYQDSFERPVPVSTGEVPAFRRAARDTQPAGGPPGPGLVATPQDGVPLISPMRAPVEPHAARAANVGP